VRVLSTVGVLSIVGVLSTVGVRTCVAPSAMPRRLDQKKRMRRGCP